MQALGVDLRLYSLHRGGGTFQGLPVDKLSKWHLLKLLWMIPYEAVRRPDVMWMLLVNVLSRPAPCWINFWENMLGAGFACLYARQFRKNPPDHVHAAWAGAPAAAAWLLMHIAGIKGFTTGAHAYDLYEHGGDWWLLEKLNVATLVHTSTEMGRHTMIEHGADPAKLHTIRRGLDVFPPFKPLRTPRSALRIVCVARLVPKKGFEYQLKIYEALLQSGFDFEVRILGDGILRARLEKLSHKLGLVTRVKFLGHVSQPDVFAQLGWADVLIHTGVIAPSGDRDGLPNVIPEAMAAGVMVLTSSAAATTEAIQNEVTGLVGDVAQMPVWISGFRRLRDDDILAERLRHAARAWVEENFDAHKNAARVLELMKVAASSV